MKRQAGFALLLVLWGLVFLALVLTQLLSAGRSEAQLAGNIRAAAMAEAVADGAVQDAAYHLVASGAAHWAPRGSHTVAIGRGTAAVSLEDLSNKVNPNLAGRQLLSAMISLCGASAPQATQLARQVMAWRGAPDDGGAGLPGRITRDGATYAAPGLPLQTSDELALVADLPPWLGCLGPHLSLYQDGSPPPQPDDAFVGRALALATQAGEVLPDTTQSAGAADAIEVTAIATVPGGRFLRRATLRLTPGEAPGFKIVDWQER